MYSNDTPNSTFSTSINHSLEEELFEENSSPLYALVDSSIFCDPELTHVEVRVYALIAGYCGAAGVCFASQKTISEKAPWTDPRNFRKTCESLEKKGIYIAASTPVCKEGPHAICAFGVTGKNTLSF